MRITDWFLYDNGLRHERVKANIYERKKNYFKAKTSLVKAKFQSFGQLIGKWKTQGKMDSNFLGFYTVSLTEI